MNVVRVIKPSKPKAVVFIGLFLFSSFITYGLTWFSYDINPAYGFPLPFFYLGGPTMTGSYQLQYFDFSRFSIDAVAWYLASCLVLTKMRKKKN